MAVASKLRHWLNRSFRPFNIEIATLTVERNEMARLRSLDHKGYLITPLFPCFRNSERAIPWPC